MEGISKFFGYLFTGRFDKIAGALRERIPMSVYHRAAGVIFELDKDNYSNLNLSARFPEGYVCRPAEREELADCSQMIGLEVGEYCRRFDYGNICYSVFANKKPVNLNWIHKGPCYVRGMGYIHAASNDEYYIYGIMTDPSQRGKGIYKNCLIELAHYLFKKDATRLIQMVEDGNDPVLHTLPKLGYEKTRRIKHITILGIRLTTVVNLVNSRKTRKLYMFPPRDLFII